MGHQRQWAPVERRSETNSDLEPPGLNPDGPSREAPGPSLGAPSSLRDLQHTAGNRATVDLLGQVQAKLQVGPAGDASEREADAVAHNVLSILRAQRGEVSTSGDTVEPGTVARAIQRRAGIGAAGGVLDEDTERLLQEATPTGSALDGTVRRDMESAFGADFSAVRVHADDRSTELNDRIQARAFTVGRDIFFRDGLPDFGSSEGQELLAHELTHTVQQGAAPVSRAMEKHEEGGPPGAGAGPGGEEAEAELSGTLPNFKLVTGAEMKKGPDDRAKADAARRRDSGFDAAGHRGGQPRLGIGTIDVKLDVTSRQVDGSRGKDDTLNPASPAVGWTNPGGTSPEAFGSESFNPGYSGLTWKTNAGKLDLTFNLQADCPWGVNGGSNIDVPSGSDSVVTAANYQTIVSDFTPILVEQSWRAPRSKYWSKAICQRHEAFHSTDDKAWAEGAGKQVVVDFLKTQDLATTPEAGPVEPRLQTIMTAAMEEMGNANFAFYTGGQSSYFSYQGEKRAFGDGKQPYLDLAAAVKKQGESLAAKAKAESEKATVATPKVAELPTTT